MTEKLTPEELKQIETDLDLEVANADIDNTTIGLVPHVEIVEKLLGHTAALEAEISRLQKMAKVDKEALDLFSEDVK